MRRTLLFVFLFLPISTCLAQRTDRFGSLDPKHPIVFAGKYIVYNGDTIVLGPKAFFIDGRFSDTETVKQPFVFNSVAKAAAQLTDGTEAEPMTLYLAPWVYWIDNPDDTAIRIAKDGGTPYGMIIECEWLKFYGLNPNAENVVLASNRGQTIGARGNFTMFRFIGQGTASENITFGNYCNVDLEFPLQPQLNRKKRASAIVQAQLIHCNGDKIVARNTRFISRLNLCPFVGGKRVLFDNCHFESTDDALCGTGVYLNCTLDFYASKPFYHTTGTGAVFLNCDIRTFTGGKQYFTKANGQVAVVDTRFRSNSKTYVGWNEVVPLEARNYQYNVQLDGRPLFISAKDAAATVDMSSKKVIDAYRFLNKNKVVYNTYNLLAGDDDWDPMGIKQQVLNAEKTLKRSLRHIPVQLLVSPTNISVETNKSTTELTAKVFRFGNFPRSGEKIQWTVAPQFATLVILQPAKDGMSCKVIPTNNNDETKRVIVTATTLSGLQAATVVHVSPEILDAPEFSSVPAINKANGKLNVTYKLDTKFSDQSVVTWYRCKNAAGDNPIEVAVSRFNKPMNQYTLTAGDAGYYIMAEVIPKHIRSHAGKVIRVVMPTPIDENEVKANRNELFTDFSNLSVKNQPKAIPGFFTWDHLDVAGNTTLPFPNKNSDAWFYGVGSDGAAKLTGLLQGRSAAMRYTPVGNSYGDMKLTITVAPYKTAGQGFSVAHLYMDVLVKLDTRTMTGYGLRFIRTTKHHDAVDCMLVKYENGNVEALTEAISTSSFRTPCTITIEVKNNKINATAKTSTLHATKPGLFKEVNIETAIAPNSFGGIGIQYNGGSPTLIKDIRAVWK